jgi:hypothetical protein
LYGSEIVHIQPVYPGGINILHDGEGPDVDFNMIIRQIVGAGIYYATKELFSFTEELPSSETASGMIGKMPLIESFGWILHNGMYQRNGRIKHFSSGISENFSIVVKGGAWSENFFLAKHNGQFKRNGMINHSGMSGDGAMELTNTTVQVPVQETLPQDEIFNIQFTQYYRRNGAKKRDGSIKHSGNVIPPL